MRLLKPTYPCFLLAASLLFVAGCVNPDHERPSNESVEYKLATIQQGGYVSKDDPLVVRFGHVLDRLDSKCPEPRERIADMGVKGRDLLREKGIQEPLVSTFENWGASIPGEVTKGGVGPCADILAVYVVLRGSR